MGFMITDEKQQKRHDSTTLASVVTNPRVQSTRTVIPVHSLGCILNYKAIVLREVATWKHDTWFKVLFHIIEKSGLLVMDRGER